MRATSQKKQIEKEAELFWEENSFSWSHLINSHTQHLYEVQIYIFY